MISKYNRIGEILKEHERSKSWIAKKIGVSNNTMCSWIKGKTEPNITQINLIADVLKISNLEFYRPIKKQ